jgi:hypothetical protein
MLGTVGIFGVPDLRRATQVLASVPGRTDTSGPGPVTTAFMDGLWDEKLGLIRFPFGQAPPPVRETSWYALGLLQRGQATDSDRARRALETIVAKQYNSPGSVFHGSYPRYSGDPPLPPPNATPFGEFDPNWRQFIGTALALAAGRFGQQLGSLRSDVERSVELAAAGEQPDRVQADYSNIAIMHAWLLAHTGARREGESLAREVARRYRQAGALDEYNSPTYDGVSLYGLALWRDEPPSRLFASLGNELSAGLWRNIAGTYHAGLRNICGPYRRAVGMDLRSYAALVGLWIWGAVGRERAPFPDLSRPFEHAGDVCFGPLVELFAGGVPRDLRPQLRGFRRPRLVRAGLAGSWAATSWLDQRVMLGGHTGTPLRVGGDQLHPAAVHWDRGWIRVRGPSRIDAVASKGRLDITVSPPGPATVTIGVTGLDPAVVGTERWELPGLRVDVRAGAPPSSAPVTTAEGVVVEYPPTTLRLAVSAS